MLAAGLAERTSGGCKEHMEAGGRGPERRQHLSEAMTREKGRRQYWTGRPLLRKQRRQPELEVAPCTCRCFFCTTPAWGGSDEDCSITEAIYGNQH